ncbi:MAG: LPS-assembly protein LptD [Gammaproteobacteria bacterium]|nr:LPS-assembly protein LptD [Gammaproteobacteria bacterium]
MGGSSKWGPYLQTPFYWNMAPNYDMIITPGLLSKRGVLLSDDFNYLTNINTGSIDVNVLPNDKFFTNFQKKNKENPPSAAGQDPNVTQAELNRLINSNTTRKAFFWRDDAQFNSHWSSHVDFNYAGDDYYLRDFGNNLNEITQNQLLQEADVYYKSENWDFTGRMQAYQTLHPIDDPLVLNQYRRFPQLILNGDYPNQAFGLEYFINNEMTHFDIRNTPGSVANLPIGNRIQTQPGVSLPLSWPYLYIIPRMQLALTQYQLYQTTPTNTPNTLRRAVPIFDVASGLSLTRDITLFNAAFQQTLEPQIYYTYIPYRNQADIPIFDTTVSTLTYDQLFNYNRFSGIDRIGDANQLGFGMTTRLIDQNSGLEKVRLGVGELFYFSNRHVTLCNSDNSTNPNLSCTDNPSNPNLYRRLSPISGLFKYNVNTSWGLTANSLWNPITKQLDNTTLGLHYQPEEQRIINLGYSYARNADPLSGVATTDSSNNLKVTDFSFEWPVVRDISAVGRWSQNWNHEHLQNLLYGLQYDTCCWAVRLVGGKTFVGFDPNNNNQPQYNPEIYIQFSLKGMGNIGNGNPSGLLSSVAGYNTQFGQDF